VRVGDETLRWLIVVGLVVPLFMLWIVAYVDVARRKDLKVTRKFLWAAAIFFGAYIGIAAYFLMRPIAPVIGKGLEATTPRSSQLVADLESLRQNHANGAVTDDDYLARKRDLLGLT
jgi:Phospholipase_D-nuclease N-terminal